MAVAVSVFFFFNDTATTEIYTLSLHDALPILNEAGQFLPPLLDDMKFRELDISYPTKERGASWGIEGQTYVTMMWNAIGADYQRIAQQGDALRDMLQGAKSVHVTSPSGTDVTFAVEGRPAFVDEGVITAEKRSEERRVGKECRSRWS